MTYKIGLIGYGNMGKALHQGWVNAGFPASYYITSPSQTTRRDGDSHFFSAADSERTAAAFNDCDLIMLAVKPQIMDAVCQDYQHIIPKTSIILSIAAGLTITSFEQLFSREAPIVRAMPNTPSAVGQGVTGYVCNASCTSAHKDLVHALLTISGSAYLLDNENLIDPLSSVSGSGPAYFYYFVEALAQAGERNGLDKDLSLSLARETFLGAAALLKTNDDQSLASLRKAVTSPKGSTEAALDIFMDGNLQTIFDSALSNAVKRAKELAKIS